MLNDSVLSPLPGYEERSLGQPRALQSEAGVRKHLRQLVRLHASGPLPVPPGPRALQRPSVSPPEAVQRPGAGLAPTGQRTVPSFSPLDGQMDPPDCLEQSTRSVLDQKHRRRDGALRVRPKDSRRRNTSRCEL